MAGLSKAVWCGAFIAAAAFAQPVSLPFFDDFESGTLRDTDNPPGRWDNEATWPGNAVAVVDAGAHDRGFGFRATDNVTTDVNNVSAVVFRSIVRSAGDRYWRQWLRITPTSDAGSISVGALFDTSGPLRGVCGFLVNYPSADLWVGATDISVVWRQQDAGVFLASGAWYLIECGVTDAGTAGAEMWLWVDGVQRVRMTIDNTGVQIDALDVGEEHSTDGPFRGTIDVDDVALTATPPPSRLRIDAGAGTLTAGACVPVQIEIFSSSGVSAAALRPEFLSVSSTGTAASLFADESCSSSAGAAIGAGLTSTVLGVIASPGSLTLTVQAGDLLGDSKVFAVTDGGGGGLGPQPLNLDVRCGCATAPTALAVLLAAIVVVRRRRR